MAYRLEKKIATQFALAAAILLAVWAASYLSLVRAAATARRVERSHDTVRGLTKILTLLKDAETGQRGFVLTGRPQYLAPYEEGVRAIDDHLSAMASLLGDDPSQSRELDRLRGPIAAKLAELRETVELRRSAGFEPALAVVLTDRGKRSMDEIRSGVARMREVEDVRLAQLLTRATVDAWSAIAAEAMGVLVTLILLRYAYRLIVREMAARRRTEADLSRLAAIVESTDDAVIGLDLDGRVTSWNHGAERLYGYAAAEMLGQSFGRLVPPELRGEIGTGMARVGRGEHVEHPEAVRIRKDGMPVDVWIRVSPIRDGNGAIVGASKIGRDIGHRKRAEALLLQRTRDLEDAQTRLSATAEFASALNQPGMIDTYRNALACLARIANLPLAVIYDANEGKTPAARCAVGPDLRPIEASPFAGEGLPTEVVRSGMVQVLHGPFEGGAMRLRFGLGEIGLHAVAGWPIAFRGRCLGVLVTAHLAPIDDVRRGFVLAALEQLAVRMDGFQVEQQRLKLLADLQAQSRALTESQREAERASRVKSEFLASMSHELRTPMNSIMGFTGRLLRKLGDTLPPRELDALQTVDRNARHLLGLINSILDLSKIEAGKMEARPSPFDLAATIREVAGQAAPLADGKPVEIVVELPETPLRMEADPVMIRQVATNLLSNGIKYTERGTVTIAADVAEDPALGRSMRIAVRDTGIGIRPEDRGRLFQQFSQLDGGPWRRAGGTGLGLVISDRMVRLHGGRIDVESTPGVGSEFAALIPLEAPKSRESRGPSDDTPRPSTPPEAVEIRPTAPDRDGVTILCVDDDPDILKYLRLTFEEAGYDVLTASGHDEAIRGAQAHVPDLICLDLAMPGKDGFELMRTLRSDDALADVPIIVVSVTAEEARELGHGARRYLSKPVEAGDLIEAVREVLAPGVGDALIIEDDPDVARLLAATLADHRIRVRTAGDGREGLERLAEETPAVIILDLMMPVMNGFAFLEQVQRDPLWGRIPVIILSARTLSPGEVAALGRVSSAILTKGRGDTERVIDAILQSVLPRRRRSAHGPKEVLAV